MSFVLAPLSPARPSSLGRDLDNDKPRLRLYSIPPIWSLNRNLNRMVPATDSELRIIHEMPPPKSTVPPAAQPKFGDHFDAWNSSSTGHQRAENRLGGSTGWRQSRSSKLSYQFKSGGTGGKHISDTVGAGSENWDGKAKALITKDVREKAKCSVGDMLTGKGKSV
jgi:hypothetical protein